MVTDAPSDMGYDRSHNRRHSADHHGKQQHVPGVAPSNNAQVKREDDESRRQRYRENHQHSDICRSMAERIDFFVRIITSHKSACYGEYQGH